MFGECPKQLANDVRGLNARLALVLHYFGNQLGCCQVLIVCEPCGVGQAQKETERLTIYWHCLKNIPKIVRVFLFLDVSICSPTVQLGCQYAWIVHLGPRFFEVDWIVQRSRAIRLRPKTNSILN